MGHWLGSRVCRDEVFTSDRWGSELTAGVKRASCHRMSAFFAYLKAMITYVYIINALQPSQRQGIPVFI